MTTREEIDAALKRYAERDYPKRCRETISQWDEYWQPIQLAEDQEMLADAYLAERQQRERDQRPPTRDMFLGLPFHMSLRWNMSLTFPVLDPDYPLDTIAKLRAACLLLGIETEGVL